MNVAAGTNGPVVAWTEPDRVMGAFLDVETGQLTNTWTVPGEIAPFPHAIERPAIAVADDGRVHLAYTTLVGQAGSVVSSVWDGEVASEPTIVSGTPRAETVLVHMSDASGQDPVLAWLEDSTLSVAVPDGDGLAERENVDDLTCDCCNPVPLLVGDEIAVAYRNQERNVDEVIRDVAMTTSTDGGETFTDAVVIADDHWYLDACPFSGPDVIEIGGEIIVAWMDGRQSVHPEQDGTTIWIDRSDDGGRTFGPDLALTADGIHRWPVMAVDDVGTLHVVWETQATDGGITYASSADGGRTFTTPRLLIPNSPESGRQWTPSIAAYGDDLVISWVAGSGARVGLFRIEDLAAEFG